MGRKYGETRESPLSGDMNVEGKDNMYVAS